MYTCVASLQINSHEFGTLSVFDFDCNEIYDYIEDGALGEKFL